MKLKYIGPARDYSGYGEANRHDIAALVAARIQVTTKIPVYSLELADFGKLGELATSLEGLPLGYNFVIMHTTPNVYPMYMEPGKYHIGRVFWETDKLPEEFSRNVQLLDEIWTGSEYNKQAIINSGVTKPVYIIPEAIDASLDTSTVEPYITANKDDFKFYSIFEWTERKNPGALLEAFWREFENTEGVSLTIKTYIDNHTPDKRRELDKYIARVKAKLNLKRYAPVYLCRQLMDRHQIYRFHKTFNCFVSAHRGEGWGIPQMEALLMGNLIISTNCGGIHEYLTHKKDALLVDWRPVTLVENNRNKQWYTSDQNWAEIDIEQLRANMRYAFRYKKSVDKMGKAGRETVKRLFSLEAVGNKMRDRLTEIENTIIYVKEKGQE